MINRSLPYDAHRLPPSSVLWGRFRTVTCLRLLTFPPFFFQAEDGIRDLVRSRGLGDVYKRQIVDHVGRNIRTNRIAVMNPMGTRSLCSCLLYTSDAADERSSVDLGGRRIIKKKTRFDHCVRVRLEIHMRRSSSPKQIQSDDCVEEENDK